MPRPVRVLLAGGTKPLAAATRRRMQDIAGINIVVESEYGEHSLVLLRKHQPQAVIVRVTSPAVQGLETIQLLGHSRPDIRILVLSDRIEEPLIRQSLRAGAVAFLDARASAVEVGFSVRAVLRGGLYLSPMACETLVTACGRCGHRQSISQKITPRQREVLKLVAEGHSTKQVAQRLDLSTKTVETHRTQLMKQLNIHELAGLVRYAIRVGLVSMDA